MRVEHVHWTEDEVVGPELPGVLGEEADWIVLFSSPARLEDPALHALLRRWYPNAVLLGCSTAGEISGAEVFDGAISLAAVAFDHTRVRAHVEPIPCAEASFAVGERIAHALSHEGLVHVFVLSDGQQVNGSELASGLMHGLPPGIAVTGGLAGDGSNFLRTLVLADGQARSGQIAAVGFYGDRLRVGYGSYGGWDAFGPERLITRSEGNVLYELDHRSALDIYRQYLGEFAQGLPASGLLFPLSVRGSADSPALVRTILSMDASHKSLIFAGDVPAGRSARMMKANFDRLIDGAHQAARRCREGLGELAPELSILVSCVGRKLVLKQRVEEEVESVQEVLGQAGTQLGFYSYGELCPFELSGRCELHNQTMTVTAFAEV